MQALFLIRFAVSVDSELGELRNLQVIFMWLAVSEGIF